MTSPREIFDTPIGGIEDEDVIEVRIINRKSMKKKTACFYFDFIEDDEEAVKRILYDTFKEVYKT
jgi:hypothetical protein